MLKKLLLVLSMVLFVSSSVYAGVLTFGHSSALMECRDQQSARKLAEVAQNRRPEQNDVGTCLSVRGFGAPIRAEFREGFILDSPIMADWEGDKFAIFSYTLSDNRVVWLIVYNPEKLLNNA